MLRRDNVLPGIRFRDPNLRGYSEEYRTLEIIDTDDKVFRARHLASGRTQTYQLDTEVLQGLEPIGSFPDGNADLDCLLGETVRLFLVDGGRISGEISAVTYYSVKVDDEEIRQVKEVELDRSGSNRYLFHEIKSIEL
jgi:hypothetical protein